jgi:hypothetical protein
MEAAKSDLANLLVRFLSFYIRNRFQFLICKEESSRKRGKWQAMVTMEKSLKMQTSVSPSELFFRKSDFFRWFFFFLVSD